MPIRGWGRRSRNRRRKILGWLEMGGLSSLEYVFLIWCIIHFSDLWRIFYRFFLRRIFHNLSDVLILFLQPDKLSQNCRTQATPISRNPQFHSSSFLRNDAYVLLAWSNSWFLIILWLVVNLLRRWWISRYFWYRFGDVGRDPLWSVVLSILFSGFASSRSTCFELFPSIVTIL